MKTDSELITKSADLIFASLRKPHISHRSAVVETLKNVIKKARSQKIMNVTISTNKQKLSASQIVTDMEQWAEHLDQYSNESTFCRIHLWKRQIQLL